MKRTGLFFLAIIICIPAFAKKHKHKKQQQSGSEIISVALRHTGCFGRCRDYTIEVNENGMATYTATRFNLDSGVFSKKIGVAKAMEIITQFNTYRVDTCKDLYESRVTDLPGLAYTIKYATKTKTIRDAKYGPPFLGKLSVQIDGLVGTQVDGSWQRVSSTTGGK